MFLRILLLIYQTTQETDCHETVSFYRHEYTLHDCLLLRCGTLTKISITLFMEELDACHLRRLKGDVSNNCK
jgi:hypothetical protein